MSGCGAALNASSSGQDHAGEVMETSSTFAMDTLVSQNAYGERAKEAMQEVNKALAEADGRLSLFAEQSEIVRVNQEAGRRGADVSEDTAALLRQALALSSQSEGCFAVTIAPLTLAWGITGEQPRVVPQREVDELLSLVDDSLVQIEGNHVLLPKEGMGIDLGGIAKGAACSRAAEIYESYGVESALLSIGGNIYARGEKPDGTPWRVGFRDPEGGEGSYIASFSLRDSVIAVSGGYERYFEQEGVQYIHILDPRTGRPAESDIVSVGVIEEDGATADFWSTTLFVQGTQAALAYMRQGGRAVVLDDEGNLYVSQEMQSDFSLYPETEKAYEVHFIPH
ncbi:FAD:protein FMN transferase [Ruminococcaceae bacterium OttesenSCG-928-I18]|nr:FAD:protein FMN transferase [Ruminococcaceae bacterium OttesenSCG-928-I18]